ncbi:MAG: DUF1573 domain-containing protein [Verrucomicrobiota bacterium]
MVATLVAAVFTAAQAAPAAKREKAPHPLVWEAMEQTYDAKPKDEVAEFVFKVRNQSAAKVEVLGLQPSCGCTVPEMPAVPWVLAAGEKGSFRATIDFKGKEGVVSKTIEVQTTAGSQTLRVTVNIPDTEETRRMRNQRMAAVDRQAVFKGDCAACHTTPGVGKMGAELFTASCAICHAAEHRAAMVPDLAVARIPGEVRDEAFWRKLIVEGRVGSLMPAFGEAHGGPLTNAQVDSLVAYVVKQFPAKPTAAK